MVEINRVVVGLGVPAAVLLALLTATPVAATTITFDALPDEGTAISDPNGGTIYQEAGFTVTALYGAAAYFTNPGYAHIDDSGTGFTSALDFTLTSGGTFDATGFSLLSLGYDYFDPAMPFADNISVMGYGAGGLMASALFTLSEIAGTVQDIQLGSAFAGLTSFTIELLYADPAGYGCAPCGHFDLDSVTFANVAPVPLPIPAALLGGGLVVLAGIGRRKVRRAA